MYFEGIRRGSEKVPIHGRESCDYDIVVGKALSEDKLLNTVYFQKNGMRYFQNENIHL